MRYCMMSCDHVTCITCTGACMHACMYIYARICTHSYVHARIYTHLYPRTHTHTHTYIYIYIYACICMHIYVYTHIYARMYTHICTHTCIDAPNMHTHACMHYNNCTYSSVDLHGYTGPVLCCLWSYASSCMHVVFIVGLELESGSISYSVYQYGLYILCYSPCTACGD